MIDASYGDSTQLIYLRARFYNPSNGRFESRDTWGGDENKPMSFNLWNYTNSNPVNYVDTTGNWPHWPCQNLRDRLVTAKKYVSNKNGDEMNTYTAAGIAVQCKGMPADIFAGPDGGKGIAQISDQQANTEYGTRIGTQDNPRGWGLLCWIKKNAGVNEDCECLTRDQMIDKYGDQFDQQYELEKSHDQRDPKWAVIYMRRRIEIVVNKCNKCSDVDKFIVAALAQNGPGFNVQNMDTINNHYRGQSKKDDINWSLWYDIAVTSNKTKKEYPKQLSLFYGFTLNLGSDGYYLPPNLVADLAIHPGRIYIMSKYGK